MSPLQRRRALAILGADSDPERAGAVLDRLEQILPQLPPKERHVFRLLLEGHRDSEVSRQLNVYERKVRRIVERIRQLAMREN
jgi:DNA-directed RNA polymerase specialized sigma24 family protein